MKRQIYILIITIVLMLDFTFGQLPAEQTSSGLLYRKELSGGLMFHTRGWGGLVQYGKQKNYKYSNLFSVRFGNLKHPKEARSFTGLFSEAKSYFYGKLNTAFIIRPTLGGRLILSEKLRLDPVSICFQWSVGPSLAFLKPVYLEIRRQSAGGQIEFSSEQYDPEIHPISVIYGRDSWVKGVNETKIEPGVFGSASFYFDFAPKGDRVLGLELGMFMDVYRKGLPIMANTDNPFMYPTLYATIIFGNKMF